MRERNPFFPSPQPYCPSTLITVLVLVCVIFVGALEVPS